MDLPIFIIRMSSFLVLGVSGGCPHFYYYILQRNTVANSVDPGQIRAPNKKG